MHRNPFTLTIERARVRGKEREFMLQGDDCNNGTTVKRPPPGRQRDACEDGEKSVEALKRALGGRTA